MPFLRQLWAHDRKGLSVCLLTALLCVVIDPVMGLLAGMFVSFLMEAMAQFFRHRIFNFFPHLPKSCQMIERPPFYLLATFWKVGKKNENSVSEKLRHDVLAAQASSL